jgi:hypothetical protein
MQVGPSGDLPPSPDTPEVAGIEEPSTERAVSPEKVFPPWTDRGFFLSGRRGAMNAINVIAPYKPLYAQVKPLAQAKPLPRRGRAGCSADWY